MRVVFVGKQRRIWKRLLLYVLTFGISRRIWLHRINKEMDGHAALGIYHRRNIILLCLPLGGPFWVQYRTTRHLNEDLHNDAGLAYGNTWALTAAQLVPILGNLFYIGWTQDRLNRYWAYERAHPQHGVELDVGLEKDAGFVAEMKEAMRESYFAGSRFDRDKRRRQERLAALKSNLISIHEDRAAYRAEGGSTPVNPWRRPRRPTARRLEVTCGRCDHGFDVVRDVHHETVLLCPSCGLTEVLPSLAGDPLKPDVKAGFAALDVKCGDCAKKFFVHRQLTGPTKLLCPHCGAKDTLPTPKPQ